MYNVYLSLPGSLSTGLQSWISNNFWPCGTHRGTWFILLVKLFNTSDRKLCPVMFKWRGSFLGPLPYCPSHGVFWVLYLNIPSGELVFKLLRKKHFIASSWDSSLISPLSVLLAPPSLPLPPVTGAGAFCFFLALRPPMIVSWQHIPSQGA